MPEPILIKTPKAQSSSKLQSKAKNLGKLGTTITGKTAEGRPIVKNSDGSISTERTVTGQWGPNSEWVNVPTIYGGKEVSEEEAVKIAKENKFTDKETGRKFDFYKSLQDAESAAQKRSKSLSKYK